MSIDIVLDIFYNCFSRPNSPDIVRRLSYVPPQKYLEIAAADLCLAHDDSDSNCSCKAEILYVWYGAYPTIFERQFHEWL